jgi:hypothetical protein
VAANPSLVGTAMAASRSPDMITRRWPSAPTLEPSPACCRQAEARVRHYIRHNTHTHTHGCTAPAQHAGSPPPRPGPGSVADGQASPRYHPRYFHHFEASPHRPKKEATENGCAFAGADVRPNAVRWWLAWLPAACADWMAANWTCALAIGWHHLPSHTPATHTHTPPPPKHTHTHTPIQPSPTEGLNHVRWLHPVCHRSINSQSRGDIVWRPSRRVEACSGLCPCCSSSPSSCTRRMAMDGLDQPCLC